ncbi:MAG: tol-pal system-associated acyl-CoA thioesterase [Pseudobdellovibrionaceae bacterium]
MSAHILPVRVYYEDTDAGGIVYHASYIRYCERGRTEYLRAIGFENTTLREKTGIIFVVKRLEAEYVAPAKLDDLLSAHTRVISLKNTSFIMEQKILRAERVIFSMNVVIVCVDDLGKPVRMPEMLRDVFLKEVDE